MIWFTHLSCIPLCFLPFSFLIKKDRKRFRSSVSRKEDDQSQKHKKTNDKNLSYLTNSRMMFGDLYWAEQMTLRTKLGFLKKL